MADRSSSGAARTAAALAGVPAADPDADLTAHGGEPTAIRESPRPARPAPVPGVHDGHPESDRLWTVPNLLSLLRLAGVPIFAWLLLVPQADLWAIVVLAVGGITDWLDGKVARLLGQYSRFGALLDAGTDRLYVLVALVAFGVREVVPWWLVALLVGRDALLTACLPLLRRSGYGPFVVTYLGKAATFLLFWAFPVLLAAEFDNAFGVLCAAVGPALLGWGTALYLYGGVLYLLQVALALRRPVTSPTARSATPPGDTAATRTA
ncbi:MAG: CDP-alcohol phosphatidyltransferase family protein [Pseudonocardia sp.]